MHRLQKYGIPLKDTTVVIKEPVKSANNQRSSQPRRAAAGDVTTQHQDRVVQPPNLPVVRQRHPQQSMTTNYFAVSDSPSNSTASSVQESISPTSTSQFSSPTSNYGGPRRSNANGTHFTADQFRGKKINIAKVKAYSSPTYRPRVSDNNGDDSDSDSSGLSDLDENDLQQWNTKSSTSSSSHGYGYSRKAQPSRQPDRNMVRSAAGYQTHHGRPNNHDGNARANMNSSHSHDDGVNKQEVKRRQKSKGFRAPKPISLKPVEAYIQPRGAASSSSNAKTSTRGNHYSKKKSPGYNNSNHHQPVKQYHSRGQVVANQTRDRANQLLRLEKQQQQQQWQRQKGYIASNHRNDAQYSRVSAKAGTKYSSGYPRKLQSVTRTTHTNGHPKITFSARVKQTAL